MLSGIGVGLKYAIEQADRWKCKSNLSALGQTLLLYTNEHQGNLPPDQGHFAHDEEISGQVFVCPSSHMFAPSSVPGDQLIVWVNAHSDYVYLGAGINVNDHPNDADRIVLMYDKEQNHHGDGVNLVFLDGHTDWMTVEEARKAIAISKATTAATQPTSSQPAQKSP
jgi:prepilin-type processing-associated H-X9-DG protein